MALQENGFPVPEFKIWGPERYSRFLEANGLDPSLPLEGEGIGRRLEAIRRSEFPEDLLQEAREAYSRLTPGLLCVRSSGSCEDLPGFSFAGQYETALRIGNFKEFLEGIRTAWASLHSPRVRSYFEKNGLSAQKAQISLIFQRYLEGQVSGVTFTVHPLTGRENRMLVEFCEGEGDKLVGGRVAPGRAVFDHGSGRPLEGEPPPGFSPEDIFTFRRAQRLFGAPQDIEWVLYSGKLWIVQSRPITSLQVEPSFGTWTTADFRDGGVSSTVVTPFMWSLYRFIWQFSMPRYFEIIKLLDPGKKEAPWGDEFFGRPYWNLGEVVNCLLKVPGFDERNFFSDLGIKTEEGFAFRHVPMSVGNLLGIAPTLLSLEKYYRSRIERNKKFRKSFHKLIGPFTDQPPSSHSPQRFAELFESLIRKVYFLTETSYFLTIYNSSNAKLDFKVHLDSLNEGGHDVSYINLISGLMKVKHLGPLKLLAAVARLAAQFPTVKGVILSTPSARIEAELKKKPEAAPVLAKMDQFISLYGFHSPRELDITSPSWSEDRVPVWRMLKTFLRDPRPDASIEHEKRQHGLFRNEVAKARAAFDSKRGFLSVFDRGLFFRNLLRTRKYCWWREEMRDFSTRIYALIRRFSLEAGKRLGLHGQAVFWLTWQEVAEGLRGRLLQGELESRVKSNIEKAEMFRSFKNPDEIGAGLLASGIPSREESGVQLLQGIGCSSGTAEGTARVLHSLEEIDRVERGDILVTPFTDTGWTPIFHIIGGVITETGGILSHAAVISREYGLPAVLNLPGAVTRIRDGARIRIDGMKGTVAILDCPF